MSEVEGDFSEYDSAREIEGGPHPGRTDPSRGLLVAALGAIGLLVAGALALTLIR